MNWENEKQQNLGPNSKPNIFFCGVGLFEGIGYGWLQLAAHSFNSHPKYPISFFILKMGPNFGKKYANLYPNKLNILYIYSKLKIGMNLMVH